MFKWENYKGLRWYIIVVLMALTFFAYSQNRGWMWIGSTSTKPPPEETQGTGHFRAGTGYRYFHHK